MFASWGPSDWAAFFFEAVIIWPFAGYVGWQLGLKAKNFFGR